jgi:hypothetical protein
MSGQKQLNLCKQLYQATLNCKEQCEKLVPEAFNAALLDALQHMMLLAVQLQQVGTHTPSAHLAAAFPHTPSQAHLCNTLWAGSQLWLSLLITLQRPCLQEEQLQGVRSCLEAALQLLSRVSSLGPVEAFFVADELLAHYQWRVDSTHNLLCRQVCAGAPVLPLNWQHSKPGTWHCITTAREGHASTMPGTGQNQVS